MDGSRARHTSHAHPPPRGPGEGLAVVVALGQEVSRPLGLVLLAEAEGHVGQVEEGLRLLAEAYRQQGALLLRQAVPDVPQAEACFQQALAIAHCQEVSRK